MAFFGCVAAARGVRDLRLLGGACVAALMLVLSAPGAARAAEEAVSPAAADVSARLPAVPASGEMGFVFSAFWAAVYPGMKENCPDGWANLVRENYLSTQSPDERTRLMQPVNEPELTQKWKAYAFGPNHTNICTNYDQFPDHPLYKTVQGKISYGLNLDDNKNDDPYLCAHEKFTSPTGETGIDNQAYRALGCERTWRGPDGKIGDIFPGFKGQLATGEYTIVMILRGVHNLVNDDNVEVILASSLDKPIVDTQQNFIRDASYSVAPTPRWRNVLHGRIVNGVLTTDPQDVLLTRPIGLGGPRGLKVEWDFGRSRLHLAFRPDGSLEGLMGGYQPLIAFMEHQTLGGQGSATVAGIDCASQFVTLKKLADGGRDPKTGQCSRISSAFQVETVPAFVFDHPPTRTAEAK